MSNNNIDLDALMACPPYSSEIEKSLTFPEQINTREQLEEILAKFLETKLGLRFSSVSLSLSSFCQNAKKLKFYFSGEEADDYI